MLPVPALRPLIIGSGISGPVLALALHKLGHHPTLYDAGPRASEGVGAGLSLAPNGIKALKYVGLEEEILAAGGKANKIVIQRGDTPKSLVDLHVSEHLERTFGYTVHGIVRSKLMSILRARLDALSIPTFYNSRVSSITTPDPNTVSVTFTNGTTASGDLLVGCDGLHSVVRQYVLEGKDSPPSYTGTSCIIGLDAPPSAATRTAATTIFTGPGLQFGCYPVEPAGGDWVWFANYAAQDPASAEGEWRPKSMEEAKAEALKMVENWHETFPRELVEHASKAIPLGLYDRPPVPVWHRGRVVLCGDSAHPTSPHGGQGAQMALESAVILARLLSEEAPSDALFERYTRLRRPRTDHITANSRRVSPLFQVSNPLLMWVRDSLLWLTGEKISLSGMGGFYAYDPSTASLQ